MTTTDHPGATPQDAERPGRLQESRWTGGDGPAGWLVALGLVVLVAAAYASAGGLGFVNIDDPRYLTQNPVVQAGLTWRGLAWAFDGFHVANWHPLTWLSHMLDVELFGMAPGPHHLVSVGFHAANTVLLFLVLRAATGRAWRAAAAAALFAVHPLHVESVAWLSERKDVLSTLFWLLATWGWVDWVRRPGPGRMALVAGAMALGLLAKPMLVTLPLALVLLDLWPLGRLGGALPTPARLWPLLREKWPLLALSAIFGAVTVLAQRQGGAVSDTLAFPLEVRAGNAILSSGRYLWQTAWPLELAALYPHPALTPSGMPWGEVALSAAALLLLAAAAAWQWRARPYLAVGLAWFLVTLLPVIGLLQVGLQGMADRYTYVPHLGLLTAGVWLVADLAGQAGQAGGARWRSTALAVGTGGLLLACAALTSRQVSTWKDSFTMSNHALAVTTENGLAWRNLGAAWQDARRPDLAVPALLEAVRLMPQDPNGWLNLAIAQMSTGQLEEADASFQRTLRMAPGNPFAWFNLAIAQVMRGDLAALDDTEARLRALDPGLADELGRRLVRMGVRR